MSIYEQLKDKMNFGFDRDLDAIYAKHKEERDKRIRKDFEQQFVHVTFDEHSEHLVKDPYTPDKGRDGVDEDIEVLVLGGGWTGLLTAARLKERGVTNICIVDGAGDFGGTWYWNRYPGAQCDVQAYIYLPLLEETEYVPKERYAFAPEIKEHAQRIGKHFDLYKDTLFHTWITEMRWNEEASHWVVKTSRGDTIRAKFVTMGTGSASRPRLPGIPGIDTFKGHSFHTSRWDYGYTGGGPDGELTKLANKRVAVIGTGSTAIQVVPHLGASAKETFVFQRTPSSVNPRGNEDTPREWMESLTPGWQSRVMRDFERVEWGQEPQESILLGESMVKIKEFVDEIKSHVDIPSLTREQKIEIAELADLMTMAEARNSVDEVVTRKEHAELLKPWYGFFCKRPTFTDHYLPTFNRPNVTLVDVAASRGVERITEKGLIANGIEYEVDCIIYASGFEITSDFKHRIGIPIYGVGGQSIYDHWSEGYRSLHGIMCNGSRTCLYSVAYSRRVSASTTPRRSITRLVMPPTSSTRLVSAGPRRFSHREKPKTHSSKNNFSPRETPLQCALAVSLILALRATTTRRAGQLMNVVIPGAKLTSTAPPRTGKSLRTGALRISLKAWK